MKRDLAAFAGAFLLLLSLHPFHGFSLDEVYYYGMSVGIVERGRPTVSPCFDEPFLRPAGPPGSDECWTQYGPGLPVALAPLTAVAPREPRILRVMTATLLAPILGALTFVVLLRRLGPRGAFLVFFGTPLFFYSRTLFSEPLRTLLLLTAFFAARPWVAGAAAGAALLVRVDTAIFLPFLFWARASDLGRARSALALAAPVAAGALGVALYNYARYGNPLAFGYEETRFAGFSGVWAYLLAPGYGLPLFAPLALGGLALPAARRDRALWAAALVSIVFYGATPAWRVAWDWGPRYLHFAAAALAVSAMARHARSPLCYAAAGWGIGANLLGMAADYTLHFDRLARAAPAVLGGQDPTVAAVIDARFWPPAGQVISLLEGKWDLFLWTGGRWPIGLILLAAGAAVLTATARRAA